MPACSSPCSKPSSTPTSRWAKPTAMNARESLRSDSGGMYASPRATTRVMVAAILQRLHNYAAAHEVMAGTAVLVTHEQVLPGFGEGVGRLGHLTGDDHHADSGVLDLETVDNVLAVDVEGDGRPDGNPDLGGVEVPHPGPHVDLVAPRRQLPHPALVDVVGARGRGRQQLVTETRQPDAQHRGAEAKHHREHNQQDSGQRDPHSFIPINVHGPTSARKECLALPPSTGFGAVFSSARA